MKLTEDRACGLIMDHERIRRGLCLPRYTPDGWWECDVFELTGSGYFREYEVKLSLADFRKDREKSREKRPYVWGDKNRPTENKHELLAAGHRAGPAEFAFVVPAGMVAEADVPQWAGLIEVHRQEVEPEFSTRVPTFYLRTVRAAPRLHREKADDKIRPHVLSVCYYRLHDALRAIRNREPLPLDPDVVAPAEEILQ